MSKALIIVDVQRDFCEGVALPVAGGNEVARRITKWLINRNIYRSNIFATYDWHIDPGNHWSATPDFVNSWPKHCKAFSEGAEFNQLGPAVFINYEVFKGMYNAAYSGFEGVTADNSQTNLNNLLRLGKITEVDICGLAYDYCVRATALDAIRLGYKTTILTDLTAPVHLDKVGDLEHELLTAGVKLALSEEVK